MPEVRAYIRMKDARLEPDMERDGFREGQRVRHPVMGEGTVLSVDPDAGAYRIQFDDKKTPRNISFRAKMEAI